MVFSGRAATGGGGASRSASSVAAAVAGDDDLHAFYNHYIHYRSYSDINDYTDKEDFPQGPRIIASSSFPSEPQYRTLKVVFHDFPGPMPNSTSFQAWKISILNSMTFQDLYAPCAFMAL